MPTFDELYGADMARYGAMGAGGYIRRLLKYLRKTQTAKGKLGQLFYRALYKRQSEKHGIEIPWTTSIGKGLYLGHAYNITVNPAAVIGCNCNLHRGVLIGQANRGSKKGAPVIGDRVWIGVNAAVVGGITIGDDVLIAPNAYVNCNVPSHSVVFGNPCVIKAAENASASYIENTI